VWGVDKGGMAAAFRMKTPYVSVTALYCTRATFALRIDFGPSGERLDTLTSEL
jgi:hypothetical protein